VPRREEPLMAHRLDCAPCEFAAIPRVEGCNDAGLITLALIRSDGSSIAIQIGAAEPIAVAGELIQAARARLGRLDWPPAIIAEDAP
jgi:hypothetical protein